ncbi:MAG: proline--tRNA ligase [candidate division NC10 bacterium]|nr:proline--tRNA ligase [candidate division NC10 bacterium]
MRWSKYLIPTLKEDPAEAEAVSHKLMVRAGLVRMLAAGIYVYLPLGQRVMEKINAIIREEMNRIGGQEVTMPVIHPAELWQQTGRWYDIGDEMFRLKDRNKRDMCLGMTHEEVVAWLASKEVRSYRNLPQIWYQIQTKERDEARPKSGVLRTREFLMKDSYSLDMDEAGLDRSYELHREAYCRVFERCGLRFYVVESDPGMMGGAGAHEFMAPSPAGEDEVAICSSCGYAANIELACSQPNKPAFPSWRLEEVATPDCRTIEQVSSYLGIDPGLTIKSLMVVTQEGPLLCLVRGDQRLHEKKLFRLIGEFRPAHRDEIKKISQAEAGFIGPLGIDLPILADSCLQEGVYVAGANKDGYHIRGVIPGQHFKARYADLHLAQTGEGCPKCGNTLTVECAIEVGNIFKLGIKYSVPLKAHFLDEKGEARPIIMGSYGIGPARIAAAAIEQNHDANGIIWPKSIAPFQVHLLVVNVSDPKMREMAERLYEELCRNGIEVLFDDRDERPGVKFKDADLLGIPIRVTVGTLAIKEGLVDIRVRRTGEEVRVPEGEGVNRVKARLGGVM